jgi:hypothetical protein
MSALHNEVRSGLDSRAMLTYKIGINLKYAVRPSVPRAADLGTTLPSPMDMAVIAAGWGLPFLVNEATKARMHRFNG